MGVDYTGEKMIAKFIGYVIAVCVVVTFVSLGLWATVASIKGLFIALGF